MLSLDSIALQTVLPTLGRGTPSTVLTPVNFDDGTLQQVLDVGKLVRRGKALPASANVFGFAILNTHAGADSQSVTLDPFTLIAGTTVTQPWPPSPEIQAGLWDFWLLGPLSVTRDNSGVLTSASIGWSWAANRIKNVLGAFQQTIAVWNSEGVATLLGEGGTGRLTIDGAWRFPPGAPLAFNSTTTGAAIYTLRGMLGVFPAGLGQDAVGAG